MSIFAQHGWGKSNKIERGLADGSIDGVIMSPRDEVPANLQSFLSSLQADHPVSERLVDPQFHIGSISPVRDGKLPGYAHYRRHLTPTSFSPSNIRQFVGESLSWQSGLDVSGVLSPTVMVDDLSSRWAQIAMMLAQETVGQYSGNRPLYISLVIVESALRSEPAVDNWLDELTSFDVDGFYLVVRRDSEAYRQHYDPDVLFSLLRVCYSLAELNEYRVYAGYTDMVTLLLHAVGVYGTGSGWYTGLRQFTLRRFQPSTGGRQPRPRYSSSPLLNSIYVTELDGIYTGGQIAQVVSGTTYDGRFNGTTNPENVAWANDDSVLHHWQVLEGISRSVRDIRIQNRLDRAHRAIVHAHGVYAQARGLVPFTNETGPSHLDQWLNALRRFRADAGV